ncbi:MAG TPA: Mur ligase family protein [Candidatus Saccharimonadales bacterium]|nr:Mur ligase family protein [Candidatus Saccharimonadales bacterium]
MYRPAFAATLVYMLQSTEYQVGPYVRWLHRTKDFSQVMHRRQLVPTKAARLLLLALRLGIILQLAVGAVLIYLGVQGSLPGGVLFGIAIVLLYPYVWAYAVAIPLFIGREFIAKPKEQALIQQSEKNFSEHPGIRVAIAGSYGKTSMKELLLTVLSQGKTVAATPANKNVAISHAQFARSLTGKEDILLLEYGEGAPGDVARFAQTTHPTHGVITGVAPAHLDHYPTLEAAAKDIFSLAHYLGNHNVYVNSEFTDAKRFITPDMTVYNRTGALGWKAGDVSVSVEGTSFTLTKGKKSLVLKSGLLGRHQVGPLSLVVALANELGLTDAQIVQGIAATQPFEHRMQPYMLAGAWVIDDTYNGNIEGIRAGTALLKELNATRKIYVTPGLVDQGAETERVHRHMGELIAAAQPHKVVLMQNSTTPWIQQGLTQAGYAGEVVVESDPLGFYTNLNEFVAVGDLIMLQNDWPDNYA